MPPHRLVSSRRDAARHRGFTIIELLVVVSIIMLLLAILLPSMKRARYVSKLTVCSAHLKQIGAGVFAYAGTNKSYYPYRTISFGPNPRHTKLAYYAGQPNHANYTDDRPLFRDYFPINYFQCPLSPLDREDTPENSTRIDVHGSYEMYFGSAIDRNDNKSYQLRLADRASTVNLYDNNRYPVRVLAADMEWEYFVINQVQSAHPDYYGEEMWLEQRNNHLPSQGNWHTMTMWWNNLYTRGAIDRNFLYVDGSVNLITGITMGDDRFIKIPAMNNNINSAQWHFLPINY